MEAWKQDKKHKIKTIHKEEFTLINLPFLYIIRWTMLLEIAMSTLLYIVLKTLFSQSDAHRAYGDEALFV